MSVFASQVKAALLASVPQNVFVTQTKVHFLGAARQTAVRASQVKVLILATSYTQLDMGFLSSGTVFAPEAVESALTLEQPEAPNRELNPHRPDLPAEIHDVDSTLYYFLRDQTEILREQHMLAQAGDSTFPWEVLTKLNDTKFYTLGSLGRFYHDDYGLIIARYVQFTEMADTMWVSAPAGRLQTADRIDWIVTNDISKSAPELAQGIIASYTLPEEGQFGWLIVSGANIASLQVTDTAIPPQDTRLVWSETGALASTGQGRVVGRVWGEQPDNNMPPGSFFVGLESANDESIKALFGNDFDALDSQIADLVARLQVLESATTAQDLATLNALATSLQSQITLEVNRRQADIARLSGQINSIESIDQGDLDLLSATLTDQFNASIAVLQIGINAAKARADSAFAIASANVGAYDSVIASLTTTIAALQAKLQTLQDGNQGGLPLVTGELPGPTLIADESGQCIFVEI